MNTQKNEEAARLSYEAAVYKEQLRLLQSEMDRISLALVDLDNAARTLDKLKTEDSIVQIGGGAFIKVNVYSSHVIVPIGAGYLVEMEREYAALELKRRVDSTKKAVERLREEFGKVSVKLQEASVKMRGMQADAAIMKRAEESEHYEYA